MKKRVILALVGFLVMFGLAVAVNQARANPGPDWDLAGTTAWVDAGRTTNPDHIIVTEWNPSTASWKIEVQTRCPFGFGTSYEYVETDIARQGEIWAYYTTYDENNDGGGSRVEQNPYPAGAGFPGFHTPNYNGKYYITVASIDWDISDSNQPRCQFRLLVYNHDVLWTKHKVIS